MHASVPLDKPELAASGGLETKCTFMFVYKHECPVCFPPLQRALLCCYSHAYLSHNSLQFCVSISPQTSSCLSPNLRSFSCCGSIASRQCSPYAMPIAVLLVTLGNWLCALRTNTVSLLALCSTGGKSGLRAASLLPYFFTALNQRSRHYCRVKGLQFVVTQKGSSPV